MVKYKKLLISDDSFLFFGTYGSVLHLFLPRFEITLLITETYLSESKKEILNQLVSDGIIKCYYLIYDGGTAIRLFRKLRLIKNDLQELNFDIFITREGFLPYTRYLDEAILPKKCLRIIYADKITFTLSDYVRDISSNSKISKLLQDFSKRKEISIKLNREVVNNRVSRSFKKVGLFSTLFKIYINISNNLRAKVWKRFRSFYERTLVPFFIVGKIFRPREHEFETQLTSGNLDMLLFTDTFEQKIHEVLFSNKSVKVDVVRNLLEGQCDCHSIDNKSRTILSPLSGVNHVDSIPKKFLNLYLKGLQIALLESGATSVHLRNHPQETGNWPYQLCDYLNEHNILAKVVDSSKPISDVICGYMGVAGFASNILRDARAACDFAFVVGFEELSTMRFVNPKIIFGEGDGIEWVNFDGTYNKLIFSRKKFHRPNIPIPTLAEKLNSLYENE